MEPGPSSQFFDGLVDLMLIIGLDEYTGLTVSGEDSKTEDQTGEDVFECRYEPQIITVISQTKAVNFFNYIGHADDPNYPPTQKLSTTVTSSLKTQRTSISEATGRRRSIQRGGQRTIYSSVGSFSRPLTRRTITHQQTGQVPDENIRSLPFFCFPENAKICQDPQEDNVHYLVLTDVNGIKTYAVCLTFYKEYAIKQHETLSHCLVPHGVPNTTEEEWVQGFVPTCYVLISKHPYFMVLRECLSHIVHEVKACPDLAYDIAKERAFQLMLTAVPPAGNVKIHFHLEDLSLTLWPPDYPDKPVVDLPLFLVFQCFHMDQILCVLTYILIEERIVFISSNFSLLTVVMESFLHFILPFKWRYTYVPILSNQSLELLEAPGTFMMGCHADYSGNVEQVEGLVVVDVDQGTVTMTSDNVTEKDTDDQEDASPAIKLPKSASEAFRKACERAKFTFDLLELSRPSYHNIREYQRFREEKNREFNREIIYNALGLMVSLFRAVITEMRVDLKKFNKDHFLQIQASNDRPFYEKVVKTDMFKGFVQERLSEKRDYWSELESVTRAYRPAQMRRGSVNAFPRMNPRRPSTPAILSPQTTVEFVPFYLPALSDYEDYLTRSLLQLNSTIQECRDVVQRAPYQYLRAMYLALAGKPVDAMDDCFQLFSCNARIFPLELVKNLYSKLSEAEMEAIQKKSYFRMTNVFSENLKVDTPCSRSFGGEQIPSREVGKEEFAEHISLLEIAIDYDIIHRLYESLTLFGVQMFVDPITFEIFYECWQENKTQTSGIKVAEGKLDDGEFVLKVSQLIKTDYGNGRIALTPKRLFFLKDVSNSYQEIIKLRNIKELEKLQITSFFLSDVDALTIYGKDDTAFVACLKEERNSWHMLLSEMWAGKQYADGTRDFGAIQQAAQNVLLIDGVIRSGQEDLAFHHTDVEGAAKNLCYFTTSKERGEHQLPVDTVETLQHRIDPNWGEKERQTVESLLYTPGNQTTGVSCPKLWCGMGDGVIKVYDATNLQLEATFADSTSRVVCLLAVGDGQVWAGSFGIYILDSVTVTCDKTLMEHHDLVSDLIAADDGRHVYSCSVNGEICKWETQGLSCVQTIVLPDISSLVSIRLHGGNLWCCTKRNICLLGADGSFVQKLTYSDDTGKPVNLDCFLIQPSGEILAGCSRQGQVIVWDMNTFFVMKTFELDCRGISKMVRVDNKVWVATKSGTIFILNMDTKEVEKKLQGHDDAVRSMCSAGGRYVMTGAGSRDGKTAIWRASTAEKPDIHVLGSNEV